MKIDLNQPYKSMTTLAVEDLPDFTAIVGRNGTGKSQLLSALKEGVATIPGLRPEDIESYDMVSFRPSNTNVGNRNFNGFAKMTADAYLLGSPGSQPPIEKAAELFDKFTGEIECTHNVEERDKFVQQLKDGIQDLMDFSVFPPNRGRGTNFCKALYHEVMSPLIPPQPKRRSGPENRVVNSFNQNPAILISSAMKLARKLPHELTRDDIMSAFHYQGDTISNAISEVFVAYKVDQFIWAHRQIESENVSYASLIAKYREKYQPPWELLCDVLAEMRDAAGEDGLFDFEFSDPDGYELNMANYEQFTFQAEMTNRTTGSKYDLDSLSSGEKVLMALCLASFNQYLGRRRPKLLLLDELDAVLHPSMVAALITTLKSMFVKRGTKVIMTSHSPMTVAALDETEIYRASRNGDRVRISATTKTQAINELSEGLATVDIGLRVATYDGARVTILTEGHNALHLKKWIQLNFPEDVHVFDQLTQYSNDSQLLMYGRLLGLVNTNTHFVIVWDCDAADKAAELRNELPADAHVTPFAFKRRRDNKIARNGIENNYDENVLKPFTISKTDSNGKLLSREFNSSRKTDFANHVWRQGSPEYFSHFKDLHAIVSKTLSASGSTHAQNTKALNPMVR